VEALSKYLHENQTSKRRRNNKGVPFVPKLFARCPGKSLSIGVSLTPGAQEKGSFESEKTPSRITI
jgi:hypothetical protein